MQNSNKPKLGLALSGAAARSVFYIGFLEVMAEQNIQIDYIAANSGSCIVAAAFACGTLEELKKRALVLDKEFLFSIIQRSKTRGGIYSMDKVEEELRNFTKGLKFEDVRPHMGFTCTNINTGEEIILSMGDIARAICASCALPGIFNPIRWGQWDLVDGGLISIIPGHAAKLAGCDKVVGIYISPKERVFNNFEISIKKIIDFVYWLFAFNYAKRVYKFFISALEKNRYFSYFADLDEPQLSSPGMFQILAKAIDISIQSSGNGRIDERNYGCDLIIKPELPSESAFKRLSYLYLADFSGSKKLYMEGRQAAEEYLPKIRQLLEDTNEINKELSQPSGLLKLAEKKI